MKHEKACPEPHNRIDKPWGNELLWAKTDAYAGKILTIKSSHRLSYQYHRIKDETIFLLEGDMELLVERNGERSTIRLKQGESFHIPPGTKHRMTAISDCSVVEVSTSHLDDVVRLEDDYNRLPPE